MAPVRSEKDVVLLLRLLNGKHLVVYSLAILKQSIMVVSTELGLCSLFPFLLNTIEIPLDDAEAPDSDPRSTLGQFPYKV